MKKINLILFSLLFLLFNSAYSKEPSNSGAEWPSYVKGEAKVVDGDTLIINKIRIRLFGIDAPEKNQICKSNYRRAYNCGHASTEFLKSLTTNKQGLTRNKRVTCYWKDLDFYGRPIAICSTSGNVEGSQIILNSLMVFFGHAVAYKKYSKKYVELENKAKKREIGIWQGEFDMPWEWRRKYK
jgi:endonuclease YncB( thermonuclease family)